MPGNNRVVLKQISVAIVLFAIWSALLYETNQAILLRDYVYWISPIVLMIGLIPTLALATIVFQKKVFFIITYGFSLVYLLFFPINIYAVLAIAFLVFGFWRAYHRTQFELRNDIKFAPNSILKKVGSMIILVFLLVVSFNVYATISQELKVDPDSFYSRLSYTVTKGVLPVVERQFDNFRSEIPLDQYIANSFSETAADFDTLSKVEQSRIISEGRNRILDQFEINAAGTEPLSDITQRAVEARVKDLVQPKYSWLVPLVFGLAIFSLLRILSVFVLLVAQVLGIFIFWILRKLRFIKITTTQITAEYVEI